MSSIDGITYNSNPPSSGPHCPEWGEYATFTPAKPLPRCNYIHNLEHGAVVMLYRCTANCEATVAALENIKSRVTEPFCPEKRIVITPDPELDVPVAAVAWQATWKATCLDQSSTDSLRDFVYDYIDGELAPEAGECGNGSIAP